MSRTRTRLISASLSTLVGLVVANWVWNQRTTADSVTLVDRREEIEELLQEHAMPEADHADPLASDELLRLPMLEEDAKRLHASLARSAGRLYYDEHCYYWEQPFKEWTVYVKEHPLGKFQTRTNDQGFRTLSDVLEHQPDLRVLVTGDSHTAGVVPGEELFPAVLQDRLVDIAEGVIECLNGGKGGYQFYNYVGVLEKFLHLQPDVFVVAVYGGNDFLGGLNTFHFFNRLAPPKRSVKLAGWKGKVGKVSGLVSQDFNQVVYFKQYPDQVEIAAAIARQSTHTIQRICEENGVHFVLVYIPPMRDVQPDHFGDGLGQAIELLQLDNDALSVSDRLADGLQANARDAGIPWIDMRPIYREQAERCYWTHDLHINTLGHRLIGEALAEHLQSMDPK